MRRTMLFVLVAVLGLAMVSPAAPASPGKYVPPEPLRGVLDITFTGEECGDMPVTGTFITIPDPTGCWSGPFEGDITGTVAFWETGSNYIAGKWERFFEVFTILPDSGGYINGIQHGTWSFKTLEFSATGWITSTSSEWTELLGYRFHEAGTTTDPTVVPLTAEGTVWSMSKPGAPT